MTASIEERIEKAKQAAWDECNAGGYALGRCFSIFIIKLHASGLRIVPEEPTREMRNAGYAALPKVDYNGPYGNEREIYRAMLESIAKEPER